MSEHTPGPWTVETDGAGTYIVNPKTSVILCESVNSMTDARLIAAAPAMYEALKAVLNGNVDCGTYWKVDIADIVKVQDAIAQAYTGERKPRGK